MEREIKLKSRNEWKLNRKGNENRRKKRGKEWKRMKRKTGNETVEKNGNEWKGKLEMKGRMESKNHKLVEKAYTLHWNEAA